MMTFLSGPEPAGGPAALLRDFGLLGFTDKKTFGRGRPKVCNAAHRQPGYPGHYGFRPVALRRHLSVTLPFRNVKQDSYMNPGLALSTPYSPEAHPTARGTAGIKRCRA
jgi:hypothetical protein